MAWRPALSSRKELMKKVEGLVITNAGSSSHLVGLRTAGCIRWSRWPGVGPSAAAVWPRQCRRGRRNCPAAECPTGGRSCAVETRLYETQHKTKEMLLLFFFFTNIVNILIQEQQRKKTLKRKQKQCERSGKARKGFWDLAADSPIDIGAFWEKLTKQRVLHWVKLPVGEEGEWGSRRTWFSVGVSCEKRRQVKNFRGACGARDLVRLLEAKSAPQLASRHC